MRGPLFLAASSTPVQGQKVQASGCIIQASGTHADRSKLMKPPVSPFFYYAALGLLPVWVIAGYIIYDSQYGLTLPWFLLFLPFTILMAAIGLGVHLYLRRSWDATSSYAPGTTVFFCDPSHCFRYLECAVSHS